MGELSNFKTLLGPARRLAPRAVTFEFLENSSFKVQVPDGECLEMVESMMEMIPYIKEPVDFLENTSMD